MARSDSIGLFWQDVDVKKGGPIRSMPKIKSKWKPLPPDQWPNYKHAKKLAIDTETKDENLLTHGAGFARGDGHIVGISAAVSKKESIYLPMRHEVQGELNCDPDKVLLWAKDNLSTNSLKIGANIAYDVGWLRAEGVTVNGPLLDVLHAEAIIDENQLRYNLDGVAEKYLGMSKISDKLYKWCARYYGGKIDDKQRANMYRSPPALVGPYAEGDAWLPLKVWKKQRPIIFNQDLHTVLDIECRLIRMLLDMRFRGVSVDLQYTEQLRDELYVKEQKVAEKLRKLAGTSVDIYSSNNIALAFDRLGLEYPRTEKDNPSFTKTFLKNHPHQIAKMIVEQRELQKLRVTFLENAILDKHVNGKLHCEYRQVKGSTGGTESGRLSAANPNLTQVPSRTELGKLIRRCFIPDPGFGDWWRVDSNQVEYRFLAHYAVGPGSDEMRAKYKKNPRTDYHHATTELIHAIAKILLERKPTKTINFGLTYGMGEPKLQDSLGLSNKAADKLFSAYHKGVPFAKETFEHFMDIAAKTGVITTILGRRSRFEMYERAWGEEYVHGYRNALRKWGPGRFQRAFTHKALNRKLQGSAADHLKKGMVTVYESGVLDRLGGPPSLSVHDELDGSCNWREHQEEIREIKYLMENCLSLRVPLIVDAEVGPNWGSTKEVQL